MSTLFFSYSHRDENYRNELDKHLSILKRTGSIDTWHDRCIEAGAEFNSEISNNLLKADIILLLVSPDFLSSDYCYDIEMKKAMTLHEEKKAVVIPVILRPCDWHDAMFGKLLAVPKDGKAVSKFTNLDEAYLEITTEIKRVAKTLNDKGTAEQRDDDFPLGTNVTLPRSSNLRITKNFSDHEKDKFLDEAFEYMANYFEGSLKELKQRNSQIDFRFKRVDSQTFTASVYNNGEVKAECTIFYGGELRFGRSINYSAQVSLSRNSYNNALAVGDDGYMLFLKPVGFFGLSGQKEGPMSFEGGAEYFWQNFIERLQRDRY